MAAAVTLLLTSCAGGTTTGPQADASPSTSSTTAPSGPSKPYSGYPDSIAVLSHSGSIGEGTEPYENGDTKTNSWATGTNPAVESIYQRILTKNPAIQGHAYNLGEPGASIYAIGAQADRLVAQGAPELVLIQTIDNDITCPDPDFEAFGDGLVAVLKRLGEGSRNTRVFVTTQFGSPKTYAAALRPEQRKAIGGTGACAFIDPRGRVVPEELRRLESIIQGYEQRVMDVCERHESCTHDGGAFSRVVERPSDIAEDLNHLSIRGHARAASIAWQAMQRAGLLPAE